jgi:hypothetical protein
LTLAGTEGIWTKLIAHHQEFCHSHSQIQLFLPYRCLAQGLVQGQNLSNVYLNVP